MRLRNKVVVITGGTRGLGQSIAETLLQEGARVVCAGRSRGEMDRIEEVGGGRVSFIPADVRDRASVEALLKTARGQLGRVDVLVSNAGISIDAPITALAAEDWTEVLETNLTGTFHLTQAGIPYLEETGGCVVNISSALATRVAPGAAAYSASKAAIEMFTRTCAVELAPSGIRVNAVAPGILETGLGARLADNDLVWETYAARLVSGRPGRGSEVGAAVAFLASAEGSYVNGHVLEVNGGLQWAA
jgi:3-oxoacyl-[acyl-carrier protein] reductase